MSTETTITYREPEPITIGPVTLMCESFKLSSVKTIAEETTVSGRDIISNIGKRTLKLVLSGRIHNDSNPMLSLMYINNIMSGNSEYSVKYKTLSFTGCQIQSYSAEDSGENYISLTVTLASPDNITITGVSV